MGIKNKIKTFQLKLQSDENALFHCIHFLILKKKFHHGHDWNQKNGVRIYIRKAGLKSNTLGELCHHF